MKIFWNKELKQEVPLIIWRDGPRILSYLWAINYIEDHGEGIYRTVLQTWRTPGRGYIQIPNYLIILMEHWPFIHIEKSKGLEIRDN